MRAKDFFKKSIHICIISFFIEKNPNQGKLKILYTYTVYPNEAQPSAKYIKQYKITNMTILETFCIFKCVHCGWSKPACWINLMDFLCESHEWLAGMLKMFENTFNVSIMQIFRLCSNTVWSCWWPPKQKEKKTHKTKTLNISPTPSRKKKKQQQQQQNSCTFDCTVCQFHFKILCYEQRPDLGHC